MIYAELAGGLGNQMLDVYKRQIKDSKTQVALLKYAQLRDKA